MHPLILLFTHPALYFDEAQVPDELHALFIEDGVCYYEWLNCVRWV